MELSECAKLLISGAVCMFVGYEFGAMRTRDLVQRIRDLQAGINIYKKQLEQCTADLQDLAKTYEKRLDQMITKPPTTP